jgi:hypothetical protein
MPYKSEPLKVPLSKDRRRKLTEEQKEEIKLLSVEHSKRELARMFSVSKRTIQFIVNPKSKQENLERREERGGTKQYYDKEKNAEYMRSHRRYKHELFKQGLLDKEVE